MLLHGTLGNIGNILNFVSITFEVDIKNFVTTTNGTYNKTSIKEDVDSYVFSTFSLSSILGQLFICLLYGKLVNRYGSSFLWINIRLYTVIVAFSQFLFGISCFFILPQLVFLAECPSFYGGASVILNTNTAYMFINVIVTTLISKSSLINYHNWHYIFIIGIFISIIYLLLTHEVKETPKYLYFVDSNLEKINESLLFYRHKDTNIDKVINRYDKEIDMYKKKVFMSISKVFNTKSLRKRIFLLFLVEISQIISVYTIISPYLEKMLNYLNFPLLYTSSIIFGLQLGGLAASMISAVVSELFSRKKLLIAFIIFSSISFKFMFVGLIYQEINTVNIISQILCVFSIYLSAIISNIGHMCFTPILINDMIPIHAKFSTIQIMTIFSSMIQIFLIIFFVPLYNVLGSVTFLNYNIFPTIAMFLIIKYLPNTKNKQVYEIFNDYEQL
ncbi:Major facilitator superfamily domain, general substrate transporter-containing protein [Strongyloides ratti]|uniref:Major facilitator superfamily domain, general substrate transporter-containing protein n=1 Tax=Strongyloides ratti TaxID=34506 RepID=A0A090L4S6_STRRB|nr:Major facilitator superfamily domain, general substrate transporter-containing protein [Strongyloides ratti]CEF62509.1 Major facilitator superfamily domain, general substrate transporter-containing protein [Strongyloides ratti]